MSLCLQVQALGADMSMLQNCSTVLTLGTLTEQTRAVVQLYFELVQASEASAALSALLAPEMVWDVPHNSLVIPWSGPAQSREQVVDFIHQHRRRANPQCIVVNPVMAEGCHAMVTGELETRLIATGELMRVDFAFRFTVLAGQITHIKVYESTCPVPEPVQVPRRLLDRSVH